MKKKAGKKKTEPQGEVHPLEGKYVGDLWEGLRQGDGVLSFPNGDSYEGEFQRGMRHGKGTAKFRVGEHHYRVYEGHWKRSMRDGVGKETWPTGDV